MGRVPTPAWLATAAAAVAVLLAVPLLLRDDRGGEGDTLATSAPRADGGTAARVDDAGAPVFGPDLGDQSDPAVLAALVDAAIATPLPAGGQPERAAGVAQARPAPGQGDAAGERGAAAVVPAEPPCVSEAAAIGEGRLGALVYVAAARWKGEPATVLVFVLDDDQRRARQVYVMSVERCALLAEQRF